MRPDQCHGHKEYTPKPALKFALVPLEANDEQIAAGRIYATTKNVYGAMVAASPGNDLLERIVRALDRYSQTKKLFDLMSLMVTLDELGGGHG